MHKTRPQSTNADHPQEKPHTVLSVTEHRAGEAVLKQFIKPSMFRFPSAAGVELGWSEVLEAKWWLVRSWLVM